jgi:hypothetical protein
MELPPGKNENVSSTSGDEQSEFKLPPGTW